MKAAFIALLALAVLVSAFPACAEAPTVGSYVTFGAYPQAEAGDDRTPIEWLVLDYDEANGKALLVSCYGLDSRPYHDEYADVTWETCSLRAWLNGDFLNAAFSAEEQAAILTTEVDNGPEQGYSGWDIGGSSNTQDKVFLLSCAETDRYFPNEDGLYAAPTAYAVGQGAKASGAACVWWLRSPGDSMIVSAQVIRPGMLIGFSSVNNASVAVRPALWLDLDAGVF